MACAQDSSRPCTRSVHLTIHLYLLLSFVIKWWCCLPVWNKHDLSFYITGTDGFWISSSQFNSAQFLSHIWLFVTPWTAAHQAFLYFIISHSLLKLMSTESVMLSTHLIFWHPLLLPSIFPRIRVFALHIRWPSYWSFSIGPSKEYSGLISFRIDWFDLLAV